ncbi:hypothetical protein NUW58_g10469 [Xylaria curta]|uniref:Uncharacterized protein n=1 Tax=Xylaria curta TaxID=42375 RepID=A0ACC1MKC1_9PEZI|nr:hypothetical protein NUW58_g10469 [Xylaria curta]
MSGTGRRWQFIYIVADKTSLGGVVGVDIRAVEAERSVPGIGGRGVLGSASKVGLRGLASSNSVVSGIADVAELVADAVEDDVGVQRLLLALVDDGVLRLEVELSGLAPVQRLLELNRRRAGAEVQAERRAWSRRMFHVAIVVGIAVPLPLPLLLLFPLPLSVVSIAIVSRGGSGGCGRSSSSAGATTVENGSGRSSTAAVVAVVAFVASIIVIVVVVVVTVTVIVAIAVIAFVSSIIVVIAIAVVIVVVVVVVAIISVGAASRSSVYSEVGEPLSGHDLSHAEAIGVEWSLERGGRVGILDIRADDSRIDERDDTSKFLGGRERSIATDVGDADGKGVEVLLSGHELLCRRDDLGIVAKS